MLLDDDNSAGFVREATHAWLCNKRENRFRLGEVRSRAWECPPSRTSVCQHGRLPQADLSKIFRVEVVGEATWKRSMCSRRLWRLWPIFIMVISSALLSTTGVLVEGHVCAHDTHIVPQMRSFHRQRKINQQIRMAMETEHDRKSRERKLQQEMIQSSPIRIQPVYMLDQMGNLSNVAFLQNWLIPQATRYLQRIISVRFPVEGNLKLKPDCTVWSRRGSDFECNKWQLSCLVVENLNPAHLDAYTTCRPQMVGDCTATPGGAGVADADFILYVTATNTPTCGQTTAAHAGACVFDPDTDRPTAGNVNFCPSFFQDDKMTRPIGRLSIAIHEIIHALVFSQSLFENFRDEQGQYRVPRNNSDSFPLPNSVHSSSGDITPVVKTFTERNKQIKKLVTPMVLAKAREHFGCPTLNGAELENNGGEGTSFSHWESRIFVGEMMEAAATVNQQIMSQITVALFEDSGWYVANYAAAGFLMFGRGKGCDFALKACDDPSAGSVFKEYACNAGVDKGHLCTYDNFAVGFCSSCGANDLTCTEDGCGRVTGYNDFLCIDSDSSFAPKRGMAAGRSSRCFLQGTEQWVSVTSPTFKYGAGCYERRCQWDATKNEYSLHVAVENDVWVECVDNNTVNLPSQFFRSGNLGPCPVAKDYCLMNNCLNDCSGKGHCFNGTCYCFPSYGNYDCSQDACFPSNCSADQTCDDVLGVCRLPSKVPPRPMSTTPPIVMRSLPAGAPSPTTMCWGIIKFSWHGIVNSTTQEFESQFQASMLSAAKSEASNAKFAGQIEVSVGLEDLGESTLSAVQSVMVEYIVNFTRSDSVTVTEAENAADNLHTLITNNPLSIFSGNPFFFDKGSVTVIQNQVSAAGFGQPADGMFANGIPRQILGVRTVYFALMVGLILSSLISLLCCCTWCGRKNTHPKYVHHRNPAYPALRPYPPSAPPARMVYA